MPRQATRYGGPGHPFEGGEIHITLTWDQGIKVRLVVPEGATQSPVLPKYVLNEIDTKCLPIREVVYGAQWDEAHREEREAQARADEEERARADAEEKAARDEAYPPFEIEVTHGEQG